MMAEVKTNTLNCGDVILRGNSIAVVERIDRRTRYSGRVYVVTPSNTRDEWNYTPTEFVYLVEKKQ